MCRALLQSLAGVTAEWAELSEVLSEWGNSGVPRCWMIRKLLINLVLPPDIPIRVQSALRAVQKSELFEQHWAGEVEETFWHAVTVEIECDHSLFLTQPKKNSDKFCLLPLLCPSRYAKKKFIDFPRYEWIHRARAIRLRRAGGRFGWALCWDDLWRPRAD